MVVTAEIMYYVGVRIGDRGRIRERGRVKELIIFVCRVGKVCVCVCLK